MKKETLNKMSLTQNSKLRTLPCIKHGKCQESENLMKKIGDIFKEPEKEVLGVLNSYIHNGKDPQCQQLAHDNKGYSALHLAVERNLLFVATKLLESDFNPFTPGCKENTGKLALHVAIEKGFDEMAALIIKHMNTVDVRDLFCNKPENPEFVEYKNVNKTKEEPVDVFSVNYLIQKDCVFVKTIQAVFDNLKDVHDNRLCTVYVKLLEEDERGLTPNKKGFNVHHHTVFHNLKNAQKEVANHPVIAMLIDYKWEAWGRQKFVSVFLFYLMSLISLVFAIVTGVMADDVRKYDTSLQHARAFFEVFICIGAFYRLVVEVLQMKRHMLDYWKQFYNWIELLSTVILYLVVLLRYTTENAHWFVLAVAYMLWVLRIFKYAAVSSHTGVYAESLRRILTDNFVPFSLLFVVVNLAFGGVFLLVLKGEGSLNTHNETSTIYGIWFVGLRTMIEAGPIVEYTGSDGYGTASIIVMLVFMAITIVVLLNILIAQLSDTYSKIQDDAVKSVRANRVAILTRLERNEWLMLSFLLEHVCRCLFWILSLCGCKRILMTYDLEKCKESAKSYRKKHYKSVFKNEDLQSKYKSLSTLNEDIHEKINESNRKQIATDLIAQTIKSKLRQLDEKMEKNFQNIYHLLEKLDGNDYDTDSQILSDSNNDATSTSTSDSKMSPSSERRCSSESEFENVSNSEKRELSGEEITDQNRKSIKGINRYKEDASFLEMTVTTHM